jgi:transposase-like protein
MGVLVLVKCPRCGTEGKDAGKEWKYGAFEVKSFLCPKCKRQFQAYYMHGALSHTIGRRRKTSG